MKHRNLKSIQIKCTLSEFLFIGTIPADTPLDEIEDIIDYEEIAIKPDDNREYFGLEIYGDSMSPDYKDNDRIIFRKQSDCNSGQDCAVIINDEDATFKKIIKQDNILLLQSINPEFKPMLCNKRSIKILGVACKLIRNIDCD